MAVQISNRQAAAILYEVADILEMKDVKFKPAAYRRAARSIETLADDIGRVAERGELEDLPGVGAHIAGKLKEILESGKLGYLDRLKAEVGPGVRELAEIGGIGPKKAMLLHQKLGIGNADQLEAAARAGRIRGLAGFGEKSEQNILASIATHRQRAGRSLLGRILPVAEAIQARLAAHQAVRHVSLAGSLRRMKETIGDIDLLASSADPDAVMAAFTSLPEVTRILGRGTTKSSVVIDPGVQVDLRIVGEDQYGTALQYFTGSKDHNIALRRRALDRGWSLSEYGLKDEKSQKNLPASTEADLYRILGLPYIEPELRENRGELEAAANGTLPTLVPYDGLAGDLHVHSDWSDGTESIRTLALAAKERGYRYLAICDHTRSPGIDRGLDAAKIGEQRAAIEQLNREFAEIVILQGIECNIGTDGTPDLPSSVLADLDIVIASVHDGLRMHGEEMTKRVLNAIQNDHVDILGHPTGRLLLRRDPSDLDLPAIYRAAADQDTVLEINSSPSRMDLPDTECRKARDARVFFAISSDAHTAGELAEIRLGISVARRGWLTAEAVVNTRRLPDLERWLGK